MVPLANPVALAVKSAEMEHCAPGARLPVHVFPVMRKGAPLQWMEEKVMSDVPEFVIVVDIGVLVVPSSCFSKLSGVVGENVAAPVLSSVMTCCPRKSTTARSGLPSLFKSVAAT